MGYIDALNWLIQAGTNPNRLDDLRRTPLMTACLCVTVDSVVEAEDLLAAGRWRWSRRCSKPVPILPWPILKWGNRAFACSERRRRRPDRFADICGAGNAESGQQPSHGWRWNAIAERCCSVHGRVEATDRFSLGASDKDIWATSQLICLIPAAKAGHIHVICFPLESVRLPLFGQCLRSSCDGMPTYYLGRRPTEVIAQALKFNDLDSKRDAALERMLERSP